jgi:sugar phosphate isomerase/epimerase
MRRVDHPAVQVNWDIMHPVRVAGVTMTAAFEVLKGWIRHAHFHDGVTLADGTLTMTPVGEGDIDHKTALMLLEGMGFDGYMSGEWINWEPYEKHLPRELAAMKAYERA